MCIPNKRQHKRLRNVKFLEILIWSVNISITKCIVSKSGNVELYLVFNTYLYQKMTARKQTTTKNGTKKTMI